MPYQWNPSTAIGNTSFLGYATLIDDRSTVFYRETDPQTGLETFKATATLPHLSAAGLTEAQGQSGATKAGFTQLCGTATNHQFKMLHLYDGREWLMTNDTLVDPSLGWNFSPINTLCYAWGINPLSMNRNGNWIGQVERNGVVTPYILTPRGLPLP